jgi:hypothetical protein
LGTKNGLFKVCPDSRHLYIILKANESQIIGLIKSGGAVGEMPFDAKLIPPF